MAGANEEASLLGGKRTAGLGMDICTGAFHDGPACALRVQMLLPPSWALLWCSFTRGLCEAAGAACAASSSKGANAWPVMSGVTRPRFQNTAVNKVKVSPFAGKEACFYELDSTWMK